MPLPSGRSNVVCLGVSTPSSCNSWRQSLASCRFDSLFKADSGTCEGAEKEFFVSELELLESLAKSSQSVSADIER